MKHFPVLGTLSVLALVSMTACVDNKYDLSDIDTTTEIKVKDLVLPLNLETVKLGDIISIKDDSELNEVTINGQSFYAVDKTGSFESDPIEIPGFSAPAPAVTPSQIRFIVPSLAGLNEVTIPFDDTTPVTSRLDYETDAVDDAIVELTSINCEPIGIQVSFTSNTPLNGASLQDIEVSMPKGLVVEAINPAGSTYDPATGKINVQSANFTQKDGKYVAEITLIATGIDNMVANGYGIQANRKLTIGSDLSVDKAELTLTDLSSISSDVNLDINYFFSEINVESVSGTINYRLDGMSIDPVEIANLPDFLAQEGTNLVLANPQIYLSLNNPVYRYGLNYTSGISITRVYEDGTVGAPLTLDNGVFTVAPSQLAQDFCFSPSDPGLNKPTDFLNASHVPFTDLSDVIAGNGIPKSLDIVLENPQIPVQSVTNFELNSKLNPIKGEWKLLAPLALKGGSGSKIIYTDRKTGWSGDIDDLTITHLSLSMRADSNLPLDATLSGSPLDKNGNPIPGLTIKPVVIKGNTSGQDVTIVVEGTVKNLDGFEFTATVTSESDEALSPEQTLTLNSIRAKVSGSYTTDF